MVRAIGATLVIRKVPPAAKSRGGIWLAAPDPWIGAETREDEDAPRAIVVSAGPDCKLGVQPGDRVVYDPKHKDPRNQPHDWMRREDGCLTVVEDCIIAVEE